MIKYDFSDYSIEELAELINAATKELLKRKWEGIAKEVVSRDLVTVTFKKNY